MGKGRVKARRGAVAKRNLATRVAREVNDAISRGWLAPPAGDVSVLALDVVGTTSRFEILGPLAVQPYDYPALAAKLRGLRAAMLDGSCLLADARCGDPACVQQHAFFSDGLGNVIEIHGPLAEDSEGIVVQLESVAAWLLARPAPVAVLAAGSHGSAPYAPLRSERNDGIPGTSEPRGAASATRPGPAKAPLPARKASRVA